MIRVATVTVPSWLVYRQYTFVVVFDGPTCTNCLLMSSLRILLADTRKVHSSLPGGYQLAVALTI